MEQLRNIFRVICFSISGGALRRNFTPSVILEDMFSFVKQCISAVVLISAMLFSAVVFPQTATASAIQVTGSFGNEIPVGGEIVQGSFNCSLVGTTCTGRYSLNEKFSECSNFLYKSDALIITGLNLAVPGPIQGAFTFVNVGYDTKVNADGTCSTNGTATNTTHQYSGTWDGAKGTFLVTGTDGQVKGSFKADIVPPVFPMVVTGSITPTVANINAAIQYRPQDIGTTGSVYVFALAPASMVKNVSAEALMNHKGPVTRGNSTTTAPLPCVLAQLNAAGQLTAATSGTLQAFLTGVLSSQGASVDVLKGVSTALISGTVFYVGYGSNSTSTINGGVHRNVVSVPGAQTCDPQAPQTGWWWSPAEDGRGFGVEVRGNTMFMSGYLYDQSGNATWVVSAGPTALDGSFFNNTLYHVSNGQTLTGAYKAPAPVTLDGPITLSFTDARTGTLIWPGGAIPIVRFDTIIGSGNGVTPAFVPENGWWWNQAESGRGFFMEFKNNFAFIAGYMYEADGRPVWYVAQGAMATPQTFSSNWYQAGNGQTMTGPYKKPILVNSNVGTVSIQFTDAANATLTLPTGTKVAITRHRF